MSVWLGSVKASAWDSKPGVIIVTMNFSFVTMQKWQRGTLFGALALFCGSSALAIVPMPTVGIEVPPSEKVAQDLGYKPAEFKKFVEDFAASLSQGKHSNTFKRICARDEDTCELLNDFYSQSSEAKRERKKSRKRVAKINITEKDVAKAQSMEFRTLLRGLKGADETKIFALADKSIKEPNCPRNLSAALSVRAEEYFPNIKARALSKELFEHAKQCLMPEDPAFERLFLRQGLFSYYDGDKDRAKYLLEKSKEAKLPAERYRTLYWLGKIANEKGIKDSENKDWNELMAEFPLSFYSIKVAVMLKKDPMNMITQRKVGGIKREVSDDPELNRMILWLEALYDQKKSSAVEKWASWIVRSNEEDMDADVLNYISTIKIASGLIRSNISMLFSYFKKNPAALNEEAIRLLYPRPYFAELQTISAGKIDTYLVMGLVRQESAFDPHAVSTAKAKGLMQIIPKTARRLASQGHKKLLNEKDNMEMGVKYLVQLGNKFNGAAELVLAAYNAGPMKVEEWMKRNPERDKDPLLWNDLIPYLETRDYVVSILRNNFIYSKLYNNDGVPNDKLFASSIVKEMLASTRAWWVK